jgi:hypothetical protein
MCDGAEKRWAGSQTGFAGGVRRQLAVFMVLSLTSPASTKKLAGVNGFPEFVISVCLGEGTAARRG